MHAEFTDHRQIGGHFGGTIGRDVHRLAADKDIERAGVQNDLAGGAVHLFPIFGGVVVADLVQINHAGVRFGTVADQRAVSRAQIDGKAKAVVDHGFAIHQHLIGVQGAQGVVVQHGLTVAEPDLVQAHTGADEDRKRTRADLGVKRSGVARRDAVEFGAAVGDQTGQQVQTARGRFCIRHGLNAIGQGQ